MRIMEESVTKVEGHYKTALPLSRDVAMPNNKVHAHLFSLRPQRRLQCNQKFSKEYTLFMETLEVKGYAEQIPDEELKRDDGKVWHIPHHGVYNPKKPEKIRVVFN